jgi:ABC-type glycerol-3-phosphate transport system permease component
MAVQPVASPLSRSDVLTQTRHWKARRLPRWGTILRHLVLALFALIIILPIAWVILLSLKSLPDAQQRYIWPKVFEFPDHYKYAWNKIPTLRQNYLNSILVTTGTVIAATISSILGGYALVHLRTPGKRIVLALLVASMFFPTRVTALVALYEIQDKLGLINRTWGLIFPYTALSIAISVFIMRGMFETIPRDLPDSARIDGASSFRMLLGIMLPLVRNGIVVVIIVNFVAAWGEYLLAFTLMNDQDQRTMPVVIASASSGMGGWYWPRLAAVYVMVITPGLIAFAIAQRWYMKGLQEGALKT